MLTKLFSWLKKMGYKQLIKELDQLEQPLAIKMKDAQAKFGSIPADEFAKQVVDDFQRLLCTKVGVDPKELGL